VILARVVAYQRAGDRTGGFRCPMAGALSGTCGTTMASVYGGGSNLCEVTTLLRSLEKSFGRCRSQEPSTVPPMT